RAGGVTAAGPSAASAPGRGMRHGEAASVRVKATKARCWSRPDVGAGTVVATWAMNRAGYEVWRGTMTETPPIGPKGLAGAQTHRPRSASRALPVSREAMRFSSPTARAWPWRVQAAETTAWAMAGVTTGPVGLVAVSAAGRPAVVAGGSSDSGGVTHRGSPWLSSGGW